MLKNIKLSYKQTNQFGKFILDYLSDQSFLNDWRQGNLSEEDLIKRSEKKTQHFSPENRAILTAVLRQQMGHLQLTDIQKDNLNKLSHKHTVTVTTGHQLSLLGGQAYFFYKIAATINLCNSLNQKSTSFCYVPVFWLASEDHDFEEINNINVLNNTFVWAGKNQGAVGKRPTDNLKNLFHPIKEQLKLRKFGKWVHELISKYEEQSNLTDATKLLVQELYGQHGLLFLDGDNAALKTLFIPYCEEEIQNQVVFQKVNQANKQLSNEGYQNQVFVRDTNLFLLKNQDRTRIKAIESGFEIVGTNEKYTSESLINILKQSPELFSPNVLMRPLYQEVVLPNIAYLGGAAEVAYWMQLVPLFDHWKIPYPAVLMRNSACILPHKVLKQTEKSGIKLHEAFWPFNQALQTFLERNTPTLPIDPLLNIIRENSSLLAEKIKLTDLSLETAALASEKKILKICEDLRKKSFKAEKNKHQIAINRLQMLQNHLFHNNKLQERSLSPLENLADFGPALVSFWIETLNPLDRNFTCITYE